MTEINLHFECLLVVFLCFFPGYESQAADCQAITVGNISLCDLPDSLIVELFLDREELDEQEEIAHQSFRKFLTIIEDEKRYPTMPLISKKMLALFMTYGIRKSKFAIMITPKKTSSEQAIDFSTILAAYERNLQPKKEPLVCNSVVFASPYALTLILLMMNVAHHALFKSYFADHAWAYAETGVAALAFVLSVVGATVACDNAYSCCGRRVQGSKCGIFYGTLFHILLGAGNLLSVIFSCLSPDCSTGAYLPITAPTAAVGLAVLLCGAPQLFCPHAHCEDCAC